MITRRDDRETSTRRPGKARPLHAVLLLLLAGGAHASDAVQAPERWQDWPLSPTHVGKDWQRKVAAGNRIDPKSVPAIPAFPGAEGHGALSIGGRGGRVIKVTTLKPTGPGSLSEALRAKGPRIVVFDVSGVIRGNFRITEPNITIAGQTAPGAGITLEGMLSTPYDSKALKTPEKYPRLHDVTIRFLRVRLLPISKKGNTLDALQMIQIDRLIVDHVSMAWAADETCSSPGSTNVTWQWCTAEESALKGHPEGEHNYGMKGAGMPYGFIHHNIMAHHSRRNPSATAHVYNNVIYDIKTGYVFDGSTPKALDLFLSSNSIGNYYKPGPSTKRMRPWEFKANTAHYVRDNIVHGAGLIRDPWKEMSKYPGLSKVARAKQLEKPRPYPYFPVTIDTPKRAYDLVMAHAGCLPRDRVSLRTVEEIKAGTGRWGRDAPPAPADAWYLKGLTASKPEPDGDGDGMPDAWEKTHGLNANDPKDACKTVPKGVSPKDRHAGYTFIEYYINDLADQRILEACEAAEIKPRSSGSGTQ